MNCVIFVFTAYNGHSDCLRLLLENADQEGAVDCVDDQGRTPLMITVSNGHIDATLLLLQHGASLKAHDIHRRTAVHRGVSCCCSFLLHVDN